MNEQELMKLARITGYVYERVDGELVFYKFGLKKPKKYDFDSFSDVLKKNYPEEALLSVVKTTKRLHAKRDPHKIAKKIKEKRHKERSRALFTK